MPVSQSIELWKSLRKIWSTRILSVGIRRGRVVDEEAHRVGALVLPILHCSEFAS